MRVPSKGSGVEGSFARASRRPGEGVSLETVWATVDKLIHDLGAVRSFVDEADGVPEAAQAPQMAAVRGAMDEATDAITRLFTDAPDAAIEAAWTAMARAQDAVAQARSLIADARARQETAQAQRELTRAQLARARQHAQILGEQTERLRRQVLGGRPPGPPGTGDGGDG